MVKGRGYYRKSGKYGVTWVKLKKKKKVGT